MKKLVVLVAVMCMSCSAIFVRFSSAPSVVLALYRLTFCTILLTPAVLLKHLDEMKSLKLREVLNFAAGGLCLGLHFFCYFESLKYTSIAAAVMLACTEVFFVAIAARFLFGEVITRKGWAGILITFVGSAMVTLAKDAQGLNALKGNLLALLSAVLIAANTLIGKKSRAQSSTTLYTFVMYGFASLTLLIACGVMGHGIVGYAPINLLTALGMAVLCTILGHSLISWSLKYEKASFVSSAKLMTPVYSALFGWLFLGEVPTPIVIFSALVILLGVYYYSRQCRSQTELTSAVQTEG